ncbi:MAG: hypothetical protein AAGB46_16700 [Verrucomicrobiota bacterium]
MKLVKSYRISTFVPTDKLESVIAQVNQVVTLGYGNYDNVLWFSNPGTERYRPLSGSNPTEGKRGEISSVPSVKLEFSLPFDRNALERAIELGIKKAHPWEEPVIIIDEVLEPREG